MVLKYLEYLQHNELVEKCGVDVGDVIPVEVELSEGVSDAIQVWEQRHVVVVQLEERNLVQVAEYPYRNTGDAVGWNGNTCMVWMIFDEMAEDGHMCWGCYGLVKFPISAFFDKFPTQDTLGQILKNIIIN